MNQEKLMQVLLGPIVSEKSTMIADQHQQFAFRVRKDADKAAIKSAVELMFEVKVAKVNVANVKGKVKRFGQRFGQRSDWKKAYITLEPGQDIDFLGAE
ncbi:50S ribosomal protein L23 [Solemya pervernicosa gill symbiont]|uniref:Large ribosomal subunit protein uL23 n=2 Tax=Gammaproteobacteria incertae sedis TaxID=118884 RepID=A0A1T2L3V6_9GAMM|nr:50S ribosomal protein L23 [Candidatus Reidiella endopervernicosa]OOZ39788.1 50S ribosomal protein L23 [Solemya pervernicosa gill symbiont]QKQ26083.1 50S ribosomal protein L23 [Candidatus Reidiella endopervernicosa]